MSPIVRIWVGRSVVALLMASGCAPTDGTTDPTDNSPALTGCRSAANWDCVDPSPGFEFACEAICPGELVIVCNQEFEGGLCNVGDIELGSPIGTCDVPQNPSGCDICFAAIQQDCGPLIQ